MSALRLGRLPDGTRHIVIVDDGAVGRISFSRYGLRSGGPPIVGGLATGVSQPYHAPDKRVGTHSPKVRP